MDPSVNQSQVQVSEHSPVLQSIGASPHARLVRFIVKGGLLLFCVVVCWMGYEYYRFKFSIPQPQTNYLKLQDEMVTLIPQEERGWPLYRDAVIGLDLLGFMEELRDARLDLKEILNNGTTHADWPVVEKYLQEHSSDLALFLEATQKPFKGFLSHYSDPEYLKYYKVTAEQATQGLELTRIEQYAKHALGHRVALKNVVDYLIPAALLQAEASEDHARLTSLLLSLIQMGLQKNETGEVNADVGFDISSEAIGPFLRLMTNDPGLFTDQELKSLKSKFSEARNRIVHEYSLEQHRFYLNDLLQRMYAGADSEDSFLCAQGIALAGGLKRNEFQSLPGKKAQAYNWLLNSSARKVSGLEVLQQDLVAVGVSRNSVSQQDIRLKCSELIDLIAEDRAQNLKSHTDLKFQSTWNEISQSSKLHHQYWIILQLFDEGEGVTSEIRQKNHYRNLRFNTAIAAIALEQHRRQYQKLPVNLKELIPEFLDELPRDPFIDLSISSLKYKIKNGRPMLYSMGVDRQDDDGVIDDNVVIPAIPGKSAEDRTYLNESQFLFRYNQGDICLYPYQFVFHQQ